MTQLIVRIYGDGAVLDARQYFEEPYELLEDETGRPICDCLLTVPEKSEQGAVGVGPDEHGPDELVRADDSGAGSEEGGLK